MNHAALVPDGMRVTGPARAAGIPDRRDHNVTEESSLVSVEFRARDGVTLNLADGEKVKHNKAFFQVAPVLDTVLARECDLTGPLWEKYYKR